MSSRGEGNYSRFLENKDPDGYFKRLPPRDSFRVLFAPNERCSQEAYDHLKLKGFQVDTYPMVGGDIWITKVIDGVDYVIAVIELKTLGDMKNCLKAMHTHIRNQVNSLHHSTEKLKLKKVLFMGNFADLDETEQKIYMTLSLAVEMEHPERVTFSNIPSEEYLPYYILTIVDLFNNYAEDPRQFPRLEKLNDSINRNTPSVDNPRDFLLLHLKEVRGVGKKSEIIEKLFDSMEHLLEVAEQDGPLFLTKKKGRDILGDKLSTDVYKSLRRPVYHAECPEPKKKRKKFGEDLDSEWPAEPYIPNRQFKRVKKDPADQKKDDDEMERFRKNTGVGNNKGDDDEEDKSKLFVLADNKKKAKKVDKDQGKEETLSRLNNLIKKNSVASNRPSSSKDVVATSKKKPVLSGSETEDERVVVKKGMVDDDDDDF